MAVSLAGVVKTFRGEGMRPVLAVDGVSLFIPENSCFTLLGPSGCGKTTLLKLLAGFEQPDAGEIALFGESQAGKPPELRPVNTVFQSYCLFPHMTVAENVGFGLKMKRMSAKAIHRRVDEILSLVRMSEFAIRRPSELSGGQQQRVALARALAPSPRLLLLDEPLSALDRKLREGMQAEIKRLQRETGITFLLVTHDQEEALAISDRIAVMRQGRVEQAGTPKEIYQAPATSFVAGFVGEMSFLPAEAVGGDERTVQCRIGNATPVLLQGSASRGRGVAAFRPEEIRLSAAPQEGSLAARVTAVTYFGSETALDVETLAGRAGARLRLPSSETQGIAPGQTVRLAFTPGMGRFFTEASAP